MLLDQISSAGIGQNLAATLRFWGGHTQPNLLHRLVHLVNDNDRSIATAPCDRRCDGVGCATHLFANLSAAIYQTPGPFGVEINEFIGMLGYDPKSDPVGRMLRQLEEAEWLWRDDDVLVFDVPERLAETRFMPVDECCCCGQH